jgi:hypothetical protein
LIVATGRKIAVYQDLFLELQLLELRPPRVGRLLVAVLLRVDGVEVDSTDGAKAPAVVPAEQA